MNDEKRRTGMPTVDEFGRRLVDAAKARSRRRWRRLGIGSGAAIVVVTAGLAVAGQFEGSDEPRVLEPGDVVTLGFKNPQSGEPLRCPDGELFAWRIDTRLQEIAEPVCEDGSVPDVYAEYQRMEARFLKQLSPGDALTDIPTLPTFEISPEDQ